MAGTLTQPSATVRAPPAPSRSWHTMDTRVVCDLCFKLLFDLLVLYVTIESTSSAPHRHAIKDPGIATSQVTRCAGLHPAHEESRGACTRSPPGSFANYTEHHVPEYAVGGSYSHALLAGSHPLFPYGWQPPTDLRRRTTQVAFYAEGSTGESFLEALIHATHDSTYFTGDKFVLRDGVAFPTKRDPENIIRMADAQKILGRMPLHLTLNIDYRRRRVPGPSRPGVVLVGGARSTTCRSVQSGHATSAHAQADRGGDPSHQALRFIPAGDTR